MRDETALEPWFEFKVSRAPEQPIDCEEMAYLRFPKPPGTPVGKLRPTSRLFEVLGRYPGPDLLFDVTTEDVLLGIELDYGDYEYDDDGLPVVSTGVSGRHVLCPATASGVERSAGSRTLRLPSSPTEGHDVARKTRLAELIGAYMGPDVVLGFASDDTLIEIEFSLPYRMQS